MNKTIRRALLITLLLALVSTAGVARWLTIHSRTTIYTDADTIHDPARSAPVRDILWTPSKLAASGINSGADDYEPSFSADGNSLYFVRGRPGENAEIYTASKTTSGWSDPAPLSSINSTANDLGPNLSPDGASLYFYSNRAGGLGGYDLWVAQRGSDGGWLTPINLGPGVNTPFNEYGIALALKTNTLYFASNRPRDEKADARDPDAWPATIREDIYQRDYDLYQANITEAGVSAPTPLDTLNTRWNEGSPAVSPFNDFLYFASDRDGGEGGYDIYRARRLRGAHEPPTNLGAAVNSPSNELDPALALGGYELYFASDRPAASHPKTDADLIAAVDAAPKPLPEDYNLYHTTSREVFTEVEITQASIDWSILAPWALPLLLLLLLLLLLWMLRRLVSEDRLRKLSLLAKCALASLLVHALLLLAFTVWQVTTNIGDLLARTGSTRVTLASVGADDSVAAQVRGIESNETPLPSPTPPLVIARTENSVEETPPMMRLEQTTNTAAITLPQQILAHTVIADASLQPAPSQERPPEPTISEELPPLTTAVALPTASPAEPTAEPTTRLPTQFPLAKETKRGAIDDTSLTPPSVLQITTASLNDDVDAPRQSIASVDYRAAAVSNDSVQPVALPGQSVPQVVPMPGVETATPSFTSTPSEAEPALTVAASTPIVPTARADFESQITKIPTVARELTSIVPVPVVPAMPRGELMNPTRAIDASPPQSADTAPLVLAPTVSAMALPRFNIEPVASPQAQQSRISSDPAELIDVVSSTMPQLDRLDQTMDEPTLASHEVMTVAPVESFAPTRMSLATTDAQASEDSSITNTAALRTPSTSTVKLPPSALVSVSRLPQSERHGTTPESNDDHEVIGALTSTPTLAHALTGDSPVLPPADTWLPTEAPAAQVDTSIIQTDSMDWTQSIQANTSTNVQRPTLPPHPVVFIPSTPEEVSADLRLPTEIAPTQEAFAQRHTEQRRQLVENNGGSKQTEQAVADALDWLARHQSPDGRWSSHHFDDECGQCAGRARTDVDMALTGLATLCFLGADYTHNKPNKHREVVQRALEFLLSNQSATGNLRNGETMYSHGIATIALCEAYGMTGDSQLRKPAQRAVDFITRSRNQTAGGWRYEPGMAGDTSVLGWQVMALASAKRVGLRVDGDAFVSAKTWLDRVSRRQAPGLYSYQPGMPPTQSMTAEGLFVQQLLGRARVEPRMAQSANYIARQLPDWSRDANTYLWYYATLALFQHQGDDWRRWNQALTSELLGRQRNDGRALGSWDPADRWSLIGGRVYQTALCTLSLEVYYRYLPLYMKPPRQPNENSEKR